MNATRTELEVALVGLAGFLLTTALVVSGISRTIDLQAALLLNGYYLGSLGTEVMILLTSYGREVVWGLVVVGMFLAGNRRTKVLALELALVFIAGILIGDAVKAAYYRERPFLVDPAIVLRVVRDSDSSYPSGHALIVSIGAAFSVARFRHKTVAAVLSVEAALVCYSRVYVGVHYPLDVIGGVFLGVAIALVGSLAIEKYLWPVLEKLLEPILVVLREGPLNI